MINNLQNLTAASASGDLGAGKASNFGLMMFSSNLLWQDDPKNFQNCPKTLVHIMPLNIDLRKCRKKSKNSHMTVHVQQGPKHMWQVTWLDMNAEVKLSSLFLHLLSCQMYHYFWQCQYHVTVKLEVTVHFCKVRQCLQTDTFSATGSPDWGRGITLLG